MGRVDIRLLRSIVELDGGGQAYEHVAEILVVCGHYPSFKNGLKLDCACIKAISAYQLCKIRYICTDFLKTHLQIGPISYILCVLVGESGSKWSAGPSRRSVIK